MMAKAALTYADYAALPNDGKRYEILDGEMSAGGDLARCCSRRWT
jgi:hypothetical protein